MLYILLGALGGFFTVALGAFGAHALQAVLDDRGQMVYQLAVRYQMWHSLALILVGVLIQFLPQSALLEWAGRLFAAGILFFCGSLYVLSFVRLGIWSLLTPLGGTLLLAGWLFVMIAIIRSLATKRAHRE